ncbi:MAG: hypothetical protein IKU20_06840 [Lachnospiraceae bacterium]|nr:hypothetical protein [Lachnospiraceae bacterium]
MKRIIILGLISLMILAVISGCGKTDTRDFNIENHTWTFSNVVDSVNGMVVACGEAEQEHYPDAKVLDLSCVAKNNVIAIREEKSGNGNEISYSGVGKDTNSMTYKLVFDKGNESVEGMAVSGITEYEKGKYQHTLVIDLDGYALYFVDKESAE